MDDIDYSKIKITPVMESVVMKKIPDDIYFGPDYEDYISNSRLKLINPDQGGSSDQYFAGFAGNKIYSDSLVLGSSIHEVCLQNEYFDIVDTVDAPIGKPYFIADIIYKKGELPTDDEILAAAKEVDYYHGDLSFGQMKDLKDKITPYLKARSEFEENYKGDKELIYLSQPMRDKAKACIDKLLGNPEVDALLHPGSMFSSCISENEQAILCDLKVEIEDSEPFILKLKAKLDNFTIDVVNNKLIINDIKTHGRRIGEFDDAVNNWHYMREMAVYGTLLNLVAKKFYHMVNPSIEANFLVVSTTPDYLTKVHRLRRPEFLAGIDEFQRLIKMVAYYTKKRNDEGRVQ